MHVAVAGFFYTVLETKLMFVQQTRPPNPYCALPCASKHHPRDLTLHFETLCSVANQSFPKLLSFLKSKCLRNISSPGPMTVSSTKGRIRRGVGEAEEQIWTLKHEKGKTDKNSPDHHHKVPMARSSHSRPSELHVAPPNTGASLSLGLVAG